MKEHPTTRRHKRFWLQVGRGRRALRRGWLFLTLLPLIAGGLAERHVAQSRMAKALSSLRLVVFFAGCLIFLLLFGWGCWSARRSRPSGGREQQHAVRRRERIRLFRLAQGKRPWHAHHLTQGVLALLGLWFVGLGLFLEVHATRSGPPWHIGSMLLGIGSLLGGLILGLETLVILPRHFSKLPAQSAALLRASLLAEEYDPRTAGEQEQDPGEGCAGNK